jgi:glycosyltransferase involved in cell wall biosynthesis
MQLRERGIPVTLFVGDDGTRARETGLADEIVAAGSQHILHGPRVASAFRGLHNESVRRGLAEWVEKFDTPTTIYHVHSWSKILSPSVFRALKPVLGRTVIHAHDYFCACPNGGFYNYPTGTPCNLQPMSTACLTTNCDRRSYAHKLWRSARHLYLTSIMRNHHIGRVLVVHEGMMPFFASSGIAPATIGVLRNPATAWSSSRVDAEKNSAIYYVGRLDGDKGADVAARAAKLAGVPLRIIGTGPMEQEIGRLNPAAELLGWRPPSELAVLCREARAVVIPTRCRETFGLVAVEALMSGIPVIASRNMLLAKEIAASGFGTTCDPSDEIGLADTLTRMATDDALVAAMSNAAYKNAWRISMSWEQWMERLLGVYSEILEAGR